MSESLAIYGGGRVKSLGRDRIGGRVITFSGPDDPDKQQEFFHQGTDFWLVDESEARPILWRHGCDPDVGKKRFGHVKLSVLSDGVWAEGRMTAKDADTTKLLELAAAGQLNWSSGSVAHLVETVPVKGARRIDSWPLAEVSLTFDPVEPRNILSVKSFMRDDHTPNFHSLGMSVEQRAMNARVRLAMLDFCRITGTTPEELGL